MSRMTKRAARRFSGIFCAGLVATLPALALADAGHDHGKPAPAAQPSVPGGHGHGAAGGHHHGADIGKPGKVSAGTRTVEILLQDNSYQPESLRVKPGETVRFVLRNKGQLLHEFNIGTADMHAAHQKEMMVMMDHGMLTPTGIDHEKMKMDHSKMGMPAMKHDDPNAVLVEPGKTGEVVWTFPQGGELEFACNVPGHYQTGMVGKITIEK